MASEDQEEDIETNIYDSYDQMDKDYEDNYDYEASEQMGDLEYEIDEDNFAAILEQKDKDLRLAAELGKALLEQNAELQRRFEQSAEEYNQKMEVNQCLKEIILMHSQSQISYKIYSNLNLRIWYLECGQWFDIGAVATQGYAQA